MPFDGTNVSIVAKRLINARSYLIEHGWCQGSAGAQGAKRCVGNALDLIDCSIFDTSALDAFIAANNLRNISGLIAWNDAPERTFAEVLDAFDLAIETEVLKGS